VVGHSMGEVAAAHVAGLLSLSDAALVICRRSLLLRESAEPGVMLLVDRPPEALAALVAGLLALPQLLPTLELTGLSNRGGGGLFGGLGVQQATAFSLPPTTLGRALLPSYDGLLFTEYIAYIGLIGLGLAVYGAVASRERGRWLWLIVAGLGIFLALGRFNPLYLLLAELPGFNLFRVPARWLMLYALGSALLAGLGVSALLRDGLRWRPLTLIVAGLGLLAVLTLFVLPVDQLDVVGPATPTVITLIGWGLALTALIALLLIPLRWRGPVAVTLIGVELLAASLVLPYNDLAPREVYEQQRFTVSQLQALTADDPAPGRVLAISGLNFDPGDLADLERRYRAAGLDDNALRTALVAVKRGEMLFPNLPLTWGLPSVDGFGGGVLPTTHYTQFTSLLLPEGELRTVDGRLGEILARPACGGACLPDPRWLALMDARYLITDKVFDVVHEGVFYDTTFAYVVTPATAQPLLPANGGPFEATEIRVLRPEASPPPQVIINCETTCETIAVTDDIALENGLIVSVHRLNAAAEIAQFQLSTAISQVGGSVYRGAALVDDRVGVFVPALHVPRILSSDIKLYDMGDEAMFETYRPRRVNVVHRAQPFADTWQGSEDAIAALAAGDINPMISAAIHADIPPRDSDQSALASSATVTRYEASRVEVAVDAVEPGYLLLADAYYPGWRATVNGESVPLYRANVMFRAVPVPQGTSTVIFSFQPDLWRGALIVGGLLWGVWALMWGVVGRFRV